MNPNKERNRAHQDVNRAVLAEQITTNQLYKESITLLKADLYTSFGRSKDEDDDLRKEIWRQFQTVEKFEKHFEKLLTNGRIAQQKLTMLDQAKKLVGL